MSCRKCCISKCSSSARLHKFPSPGKYLEKFRMWVHSINDRDINEMDPVMVYRSKRVCHKHFEAKYHSSMSSRLQPMAVPTLYLRDIKIEYDETENEIVSNDCDFWSFSETLALVEAYDHHRKSFAKDGHELQTWSQISSELSSKNIHRSPESCESKWESLVKKHNGDQTNYEFHNNVCNAEDGERMEQSSKRHEGDCECYETKIVEKQKRHRERMDMMKRKLDIEERKLAAFDKYLAHLSNGKEWYREKCL